MEKIFLPHSEREIVGYVPQNSISRNQNFPATVEEIMMTGVYSSSWKARFRAKKEIPRLKAALAEMEMEEFWKRRIGDLSGGQQQRVMLARALAGKPKILILDDSASALDFATDAALRHAIHEQTKGMTVFIVSQRATSIKQADKILVLDDGELAGVGTHKELMESCEVYREICLSQLSEQEVNR